MKDLKKDQQSLFQTDATEALERVRVALAALWADPRISIHDKVAGDFDYEELIAALLSAEAALVEEKFQVEEDEGREFTLRFNTSGRFRLQDTVPSGVVDDDGVRHDFTGIASVWGIHTESHGPKVSEEIRVRVFREIKTQ